jgi:hypothetical protein
VHRARDLRETRVYIINTVLDENQIIRNQPRTSSSKKGLLRDYPYEPTISLKLIFYSKLNRLIRLKESYLYHPSVTIEFNDIAYNNSNFFNKWINEELAIGLTSNSLLIIDYAAFYKTELTLLKL